MKKLLSIFASTLIILIAPRLSGCSNVSSHYKAVALVSSNTNTHASISFYKLEGTIVLKLKSKNNSSALSYTANLDGGSATVYYNAISDDSILFRISTNEKVESAKTNIEKGIMHIIIVTGGQCNNGRFDFKLESWSIDNFIKSYKKDLIRLNQVLFI